jgi:hypothetical protein
VNEDALRRIEDELGPNVIDRIVGLPGADVTTVMLEIARRRAAKLDAAEVMRRYRADRFVGPAGVAVEPIRRVETALFSALPDGFETIVLSPVAPLGTHHLAGVDQSRVVTTVRANEVAADPTNGLSLEAAIRRRVLLREDPRSAGSVRLASSQRVVRAQRFEGDAAFTHFQIFGLVTAGRDTGDLRFERDAFVEHVRFAASAIRIITGSVALVALTDLTGVFWLRWPRSSEKPSPTRRSRSDRIAKAAAPTTTGCASRRTRPPATLRSRSPTAVWWIGRSGSSPA